MLPLPLVLCSSVWGQTSDSSAPAKAYWETIKYSALVDVYVNKAFNDPGTGLNSLRNFDVKANRFDLNMARFVLSHDAAPVGFRVDFAAGRSTELIHGAEAASEAWRYIQQAYVTLKPFKNSGFQIDAGKFYTAAGAEPTESHLNWNYSRSLLYANGPYYHFGVRAAMPLTSNFTVGAQLLNGWNNIRDNNDGKTVGLTSSLSLGKVSWSNVYYVGSEKIDALGGKRHFYDTVLMVNWNPKVSSYVNFDYGSDRSRIAGDNSWYGVAFATRAAINDKVAVSPRFEVYNDTDGFITGAAQRLQEFTLTGEYKLHKNVLSRLEYRRDWSDTPYFSKGPGVVRNQSTVLLGLMAYFDKE